MFLSKKRQMLSDQALFFLFVEKKMDGTPPRAQPRPDQSDRLFLRRRPPTEGHNMADDPMLCTGTHTQAATSGEAPMLIDLPWEIITSVASYLNPNDLCRLDACCCHLSVLRDDTRLWRRAVAPLFSQALLDRLDECTAQGQRVDWRRQYFMRRDVAQATGNTKGDRVMGQKVTFAADGAVCIQRGLFVRKGDHADIITCDLSAHPADEIIYRALVSPLLADLPSLSTNNKHGTPTADDATGGQKEKESSDRCQGALVDYARPPTQVPASDASPSVDDEKDTRTSPPVHLHRYANGDVHAYINDDDEGHPCTLWFQVSPQCTNKATAGRVVCRAGWEDIILDGTDGRRLHVFHPLDSAGLPPERALFDWYVRSGRIAWDAETRAACPLIAYPSMSMGPQDWGWSVPHRYATVDDQRPWLARAEPYVYKQTCLPRHWAETPCAITGTTHRARGMHMILSNGTVVDTSRMAEFGRALSKYQLPALDPTTGQQVYAVGFVPPWWMDALDPRWATAAVAAAYRRLWTLVADGADLLACHPDSVVASLVSIAALDAHTRHAPGFRDDDSAWADHSARFMDRLRDGTMRSPAHELYAGVATSFMLARLVDVDIPAPPANSRGALPHDWQTIAASPSRALDFAESELAFVRARLERVTFVDRVLCAATFAGATLVGCRFTRCVFAGPIFVDAILHDCSFVDCIFVVACLQRRVVALRVEGPVSCLLARLGCHRTTGVTGHA
ncbi:Pentapeptide 4 superfamily incomplete domain containing protein [Pandoravirus celtis]|uniref:Pentapeptide 4 superfamily incomplete domain containing protein n=1 Tax=Pandoravirus celtis TaxID=2568002 RepID=A0A4D6EFW1_9VIRU|nr:Pentapeptide 4 superfamily incomplete domain containing protein [Pandoravirus celtis]